MSRRFFLAPILLLAGCAKPYGVAPVVDESYPCQWHLNRAGDGRLTGVSWDYLGRHSLRDEYQKSPREAMTALIARFAQQPTRASAFVLAELSYLEGLRAAEGSEERSRCFFTSAMLAYAHLFDSSLTGARNPFEWNHRLAAELYNRAIAHVPVKTQLTGEDWDGRKSFESTIGRVNIVARDWRLPQPPSAYDRLEIADRFQARGFEHLSHKEGIGVPLIAVTTRRGEVPKDGPESFLPDMPERTAPATFCVRFRGSIADLVRGQTEAVTAEFVVLNPLNETTIEIDSLPVPIEADFTTPLAYALERAPEVSGFGGFMDTTSWGDRRGLFMLHPYQPGRIPVVFVNGLMGKPSTWVPMVNELIADDAIRSRYQFWYFMYPTGNPILFSAAVLRKELQRAQAVFDPDGTNAAFNQMVIVGHSMGGVIARFQVTNSGTALWDAVMDQPFESIHWTGTTGVLARSMLLFGAQPFVKRVVFMATPHRGSELADEWFARMFAADVKIPQLLVAALSEAARAGAAVVNPKREKVTAVEGLSAKSPILAALNKLPIAEGVKYDSIIANKDEAGVAGGTDMIVPYSSAHLEGAESEVIICSKHGCTRNPSAIEEVRRVLLNHLEELDGPKKASR